MTGLSENRTATIYGAGGAIGGAVVEAFAREGARVFLTGRTLAPLERVAKGISQTGGLADVAHPTLAELANVAAFAASDKAEAMTGAVVKVDGGSA